MKCDGSLKKIIRSLMTTHQDAWTEHMKFLKFEHLHPKTAHHHLVQIRAWHYIKILFWQNRPCNGHETHFHNREKIILSVKLLFTVFQRLLLSVTLFYLISFCKNSVMRPKVTYASGRFRFKVIFCNIFFSECKFYYSLLTVMLKVVCM